MCFTTARLQFVPLKMWQIWTSKFGSFFGTWCFHHSKTPICDAFRSGKNKLLSFQSIFRNIWTVFSSSFLYLLTKRHCHILAYNITSLCLAPKEFGVIFLQLVHAASIVPVWHLMVERPRLTYFTISGNNVATRAPYVLAKQLHHVRSNGSEVLASNART